MNLQIVASFLLLVFPSFVTPGPNNFMLMASAAKFGIRPTIPHAIGVNTGFPLMVFLIGLGLGEVFAAFPQVQIVLKYFAAAYFLWLAYKMLGLKVGDVKSAARPMRYFEAVLFQWVNPKAWVISVSFVSAFVAQGEWRLPSLVLIALGCMATGPFASVIWMVFGHQLQSFLRRTGTERFLGAILAVLMIGAVVLFLI